MSQKIALITGGNRGLGKNMAQHLAKKGVGVVITFRSNEKEAYDVVNEIRKFGINAAALRLDVSQSSSFAGFVKQLKETLNSVWKSERFDYLVNNAGFGVYSSFEATTEEQFDELYRVHFKGVFFLTQKLLPLMQDGGAIVNISSGLARFSYPGYAAYASMKGGVEVLTRYLAKELGPRKIRVNSFAPGAIETDFGGGMVRDNQQVNSQIASQTALGRVGVVDDIGAAVASLLTDDFRWINGQRLEASGGIHL